jgi:hypothetical protein
MDVVQPLCDGTLQPATLAFTNGLGGPDTFAIRCCLESIRPTTAAPLSLQALDAGNGISGTSNPFQGVAKGDVDASSMVDVLDVTRAVRLALNQAVPLPPPATFQRWAANMPDPNCMVDASINVLDVIRVRNKALGLPPLCPCPAATPAPGAATPRASAGASTAPLSLRLVRGMGRDHLLVVRGAQDLGGLQIELRGFGPEAAAATEGLTAGQSWQVFTEAGLPLRQRVLAFSNMPTGVSGNGTVLRITGGRRARLVSAIASDSQGREIPVVIEGR